MDTNRPLGYLDPMTVEDNSDCMECPYSSSGVVSGMQVEQASTSQSPALNGVRAQANDERKSSATTIGAVQEVNGQVTNSGRNKVTKARDPSSVNSGLHPLLFPYVVEDVLDNLPANEVESLRLVCRVWNIAACQVLKSKKTVVFAVPEAVKSYIATMRHTSEFPHAQYKFYVPEDFKIILNKFLREFVALFGSHIESLEFHQPNIFWEDFMEVVKATPCLERLALRYFPKEMNQAILKCKLPSIKIIKIVYV